MPSSDYASAVVSGSLKLKGANIDKTKKKKKKKDKPQTSQPTTTSTSEQAPENHSDAEPDAAQLQQALAEEDADVDADADARQADEKKETARAALLDTGKTETQRRFDERRKKRLDERLKREGVRTHKERVQQLNQYLSTLSEHNDMPRIGPG